MREKFVNLNLNACHVTYNWADKEQNLQVKIKSELRWPGIEPGSTAWKAAMLTAIPPTLCE